MSVQFTNSLHPIPPKSDFSKFSPNSPTGTMMNRQPQKHTVCEPTPAPSCIKISPTNSKNWLQTNHSKFSAHSSTKSSPHVASRSSTWPNLDTLNRCISMNIDPKCSPKTSKHVPHQSQHSHTSCALLPSPSHFSDQFEFPDFYFANTVNSPPKLGTLNRYQFVSLVIVILDLLLLSGQVFGNYLVQN
jgi:hypothetical protein